MHLLIPFAAPASEAGREALKTLELPQLRALLAHAGEPVRDDGDAYALSPPHERALARELGFAGADGLLPWAAWQAARDGVLAGQPDDLAWGLLTPVHAQVGSDQVSVADPAALALDEAASRAFFEAVQPLFVDDGCVFVWGAPTRWYLAHESLSGLATASPDRIIGRSIDPWLPRSPAARRWRRLQNELQMLLHAHPLNDAREAAGLLPVNSVWLSGCGVAQPARETPGLVVDERLRGPALAEDWPAWAEAWRALDAGPVAGLAAPGAGAGTLTLCGEGSAVRLPLQPPGAWQRLAALWRRPDARALLETL